MKTAFKYSKSRGQSAAAQSSLCLFTHVRQVSLTIPYEPHSGLARAEDHGQLTFCQSVERSGSISGPDYKFERTQHFQRNRWKPKVNGFRTLGSGTDFYKHVINSNCY